MKKKNVKKYLLMVVALMLMCVVSVAGTLAYLSATTEKVTNTFAIGKLFDEQNEGKFELKEHLATYTANGSYTLTGEGGAYNAEVTANTYDKILPGVNLSKDPFVRIAKLQVDAYLFIEVVNALPETLTYEIDDTWVVVEGVEGKHGGTVYRYAGNDGVVLENSGTNSEPYVFNILKDKQIIVSAQYAGDDDATTAETLSFYAYMIQAAGIADAATAWGQIPNPASGQ